VAASRPPPASISSEPAAKGTSAPVAGGAITAFPLSGLEVEVEVVEVPSTPLVGAGEPVGIAVGVGRGPEVVTGIGVAVPVEAEVVPVWVDLVVVWLDVVVLRVVGLGVGVGVGVAADTTCTAGDPESSAPAGP
jgi:hypothetical protein